MAMFLHQWPQEHTSITALCLSDFVTSLRKLPVFPTPLRHHYGRPTRDLVGDPIVFGSLLVMQGKVSAMLQSPFSGTSESPKALCPNARLQTQLPPSTSPAQMVKL